MMHNRIEEIAIRIKEILLAERSLLALGRAADALALGEEKGIAIQKLEEALRASDSKRMAKTLHSHIEGITRIAKENEIHFLAVRNGIKSLIARLEGMNSSVCAGIYNQHGEEIRFSGAMGGYLKKV